jgi:ABC-type antimicrobial peptide transport system permease subunit
MPGILPAIVAAAVLSAAAVIAALMPAARASRVDVLQALRWEQGRSDTLATEL